GTVGDFDLAYVPPSTDTDRVVYAKSDLTFEFNVSMYGQPFQGGVTIGSCGLRGLVAAAYQKRCPEVEDSLRIAYGDVVRTGIVHIPAGTGLKVKEVYSASETGTTEPQIEIEGMSGAIKQFIPASKLGIQRATNFTYVIP
ncbi:MAG: hypothetical protein WC254_03720, partial [Candidatus Woesearchaeota archaeon]